MLSLTKMVTTKKLSYLIKSKINYLVFTGHCYPDMVLNVSKTNVICQHCLQLPNGTYTGSLGDLLSRRVDIIMNAFFIKDYGTPEFEFTAAVYFDRLCFIVRASALVSIATNFKLN